MRRGVPGLSPQVQTVLEHGRGDLIKLVWFDRDGLCLLATRLERSRFVWPLARSGGVSPGHAQLSTLLERVRLECTDEDRGTYINDFASRLYLEQVLTFFRRIPVNGIYELPSWNHPTTHN